MELQLSCSHPVLLPMSMLWFGDLEEKCHRSSMLDLRFLVEQEMVIKSHTGIWMKAS
jgi:hypothetical protein